MSSQRDLESRNTPDERAPLLAHDDGREYTAVPSERGDIPEDTQKEVSRTWKYVWRGFLAVFSILIIVVFVKAWIDADDVKVRTS